jgi:hypothetical protein
MQENSVLGLFFDPECGSDMFLRNIDWLSTDYMALYLINLQNHSCENLKPYNIPSFS